MEVGNHHKLAALESCNNGLREKLEQLNEVIRICLNICIIIIFHTKFTSTRILEIKESSTSI